LFVLTETAFHKRPRVLDVSASLVVLSLSFGNLVFDLRFIDQIVSLDVFFQIELSKFERLFRGAKRGRILVDLKLQFLLGRFDFSLGFIDARLPFGDVFGDLRRVELNNDFVFFDNLNFGR